MKKFLSGALLSVSALTLAACGAEESKETSTEKETTGKSEPTELVVGASNTPHAVILEEVKPMLEEQGIELRN